MQNFDGVTFILPMRHLHLCSTQGQPINFGRRIAQCAFLHAITTDDGETALGQITAIWFGENTKNTFTLSIAVKSLGKTLY